MCVLSRIQGPESGVRAMYVCLSACHLLNIYFPFYFILFYYLSFSTPFPTPILILHLFRSREFRREVLHSFLHVRKSLLKSQVMNIRNKKMVNTRLVNTRKKNGLKDYAMQRQKDISKKYICKTNLTI